MRSKFLVGKILNFTVFLIIKKYELISRRLAEYNIHEPILV